MRWGPLAALAALLLAGCSQGTGGNGPDADPAPDGEGQAHADNLTARLAPGSGEFFPELWYLDRVDVPGGVGDANVTLALGLGLRCEGDPSSAIPGAGWVDCAVRLARDPSALSRDRRALEAGFDFQILTSRTPTEAIEWRVMVETSHANGSSVAAFDSGWRAVDLSPVASVPVLRVDVVDPCDRDDRFEDEELWGEDAKAGKARLNVSFTTARVVVNFTIGLGDSRPVGATANPPANGRATAAGFEARFPAREQTTAMWLLLAMDLQTNSTTPAPAAAPCSPATVAHEVQHWSVAMEYVDAAGVRRTHPAQGVDVDVYRSAA